MSYRILRRLGSGGMAEVFLARWRGGLVAVKKILPHLAELARVRALFREEARIAARVEHPNVVRVRHFGEAQGELFIALEYVAGRDLRAIVEPMPALLAAWIACSVGSGLEAAHRLGVVHRDVTPANVLVGDDGAVKLADFGVAAARGRAGTRGYASPEQARGEPGCGRSDLFSLGVVAHELATGRRLFARATEAETLDAILHAPIPRIHPTIDRLLERDPARRAVARVELDAARLAAWVRALPGLAPDEQGEPTLPTDPGIS
jgi:serine/threonine-protein kinase